MGGGGQIDTGRETATPPALQRNPNVQAIGQLKFLHVPLPHPSVEALSFVEESSRFGTSCVQIIVYVIRNWNSGHRCLDAAPSTKNAIIHWMIVLLQSRGATIRCPQRMQRNNETNNATHSRETTNAMHAMNATNRVLTNEEDAG